LFWKAVGGLEGLFCEEFGGLLQSDEGAVGDGGKMAEAVMDEGQVGRHWRSSSLFSKRRRAIALTGKRGCVRCHTSWVFSHI
jgi:hypothetical protein